MIRNCPRRLAASLALAVGLILTAPGTAAPAGEPEAALPQVDAERAARDAELRLKALDAARKIFVRVVITPRWDEDCALEAMVRNDSSGRGFWGYQGRAALSRLDQLLEKYQERRSIAVAGVLLDKGLVAVDDDGSGWEWKLVGGVEVQDAAGKRWPAKVSRVLTRASAFVFALEGENLPEPGAWRENFKLSPAEQLVSVTLVPDPADPEKWFVASGGALLPFDAGPAAPERLTYAGRARASWAGPEAAATAVLFDAQVRPVGVMLQGARLDNGDPAAWQPKAMLASGAAAWADVEKAEARASAEALRLAYKVRFEFRVEKDDEEGGGSFLWRRPSRFGGEGSAQDAEAFGISVGGGRIFIPQMLEVEPLRMVDKISVKVGGEWKPAEFVGAFRDIAGMLVAVRGAELAEAPGLLATKGVEPMKPFIYCQAEEFLGRVRAEPRCVRYLTLRRAYADRLRPEANYVPPGALLFALDGKLAGVAVRERRAPTLLAMATRSAYGERGVELNLAGFAEMAGLLADPGKSCDGAWRPMTRQESRRLCWLGVEFEAINEELAERLLCTEETRGGAIGLIVSTVYPGSPAATLGIRPQDILLRLAVEGLGDPMPLVARYAAAGEGWSRGGMMGRMGPGGGGGGGRVWRARSNFLTRLLTEAGPGRKAEITYLAASPKREIKTGRFELAYAPEDYDSAEKYKDEKLGMAVKPITYEVREALGLKPEDPGVVISWTEQGSNAQVARLTPYMLLTGIDGRPVSSVADFKKIVDELRAQKKDTIKVQVSVMGKSRFADLKLGD